MQQKKKVDRKRFVRYKEGAEMYSMCQSKFEDMARDAGAEQACAGELRYIRRVPGDLSNQGLRPEMRYAKFLELVLDLLTGNK